MESDNDPIVQQLKIMISENRGIPLQKLRLEDTLFQDLGMYGDDALEFLVEYAKTFEIDMTGFDFSKYFRSEGWSWGDSSETAIWLSKSYRWSLNYTPITILDIIRIAKKKKWLD